MAAEGSDTVAESMEEAELEQAEQLVAVAVEQTEEKVLFFRSLGVNQPVI